MKLCSSCKQPEHFGQGCKTLAEGPPQPSEEVTKARRAYLESEEFKRICAASLAGKKPFPPAAAPAACPTPYRCRAGHHDLCPAAAPAP